MFTFHSIHVLTKSPSNYIKSPKNVSTFIVNGISERPLSRFTLKFSKNLHWFTKCEKLLKFKSANHMFEQKIKLLLLNIYRDLLCVEKL